MALKWDIINGFRYTEKYLSMVENKRSDIDDCLMYFDDNEVEFISLNGKYNGTKFYYKITFDNYSDFMNKFSDSVFKLSKELNAQCKFYIDRSPKIIDMMSASVLRQQIVYPEKYVGQVFSQFEFIDYDRFIDELTYTVDYSKEWHRLAGLDYSTSLDTYVVFIEVS